MDILLIASDFLVRDQIKVGLQQFPEFRVTWGENYPGVNQVRLYKYDYVFLELEGGDHEGLRLLRHLRSFDTSTEVIAIAEQRLARDLHKEKGKLGISSFLATPIDVADFFRLVARIKSRHEEALEAAANK